MVIFPIIQYSSVIFRKYSDTWQSRFSVILTQTKGRTQIRYNTSNRIQIQRFIFFFQRHFPLYSRGLENNFSNCTIEKYRGFYKCKVKDHNSDTYTVVMYCPLIRTSILVNDHLTGISSLS